MISIELTLLLFLDPVNEMRFNKQEMITLAQQPSNRFDKEGLLFVRERQEGFFRRTESEYLYYGLLWLVYIFEICLQKYFFAYLSKNVYIIYCYRRFRGTIMA